MSYNYPVTKTAPRTVPGSLSYSSQRSHMADDLRYGLSHSCQRGPTYKLFHFQNELPRHVLSRIFQKHIKGFHPTKARANERVVNTNHTFHIRHDIFGMTEKRNTAAHFKYLFCKMKTKRHNTTRLSNVFSLYQREVCVCVCVCVYIYIYIHTYTHTKAFLN